MLEAIFYARFHTARGPSVVHQYPTNSIVASWDSGRTALFDFSEIVSYVIPAYELCGRPLSVYVPATTKHHKAYRVLGFPCSIEDSKYDRNRFTFNVCFVLDAQEDGKPWEQIVKKTAHFFQALEVEDGLLKAEEMLPGLRWAGESEYPAEEVGVIHELLEGIVEELNAYGETCMLIDQLHILNLRFSESREPDSVKVRAWQVPVLVAALPDRAQWTWDLTLDRIVPFIDGVKHIQRLAEEADADVKLVKKAVRELVLHNRAILLDLFHFQACYTTTNDFTWFVKDQKMLDECRRFVTCDKAVTSPSATNGTKPVAEEPRALLHEDLIELYGDLRTGLHLADFCRKHEVRLSGIDTRRFIIFGQIKGFLTRVHRYALSTSSAHSSAEQDDSMVKSLPKSNEEVAKELDRAWRKAALTSGWATPPSSLPMGTLGTITNLSKSQRSNEEIKKAQDAKLRKYLDGQHCFDQICVEMRMTEKQVVERLRAGSLGDVVLFWK